MANLLPDKTTQASFAMLDPEQRTRFATRLSALIAAYDAGIEMRRLTDHAYEFEAPLEELQNEAALVTAADLLDRIERARAATLDRGRSENEARPGSRSASLTNRCGELVCYWPGRSLSTAEAEVASRGYFDVLDRPPIGFWLEAIARPGKSIHRDFEIAIISWVPTEDLDRARAGVEACPNGSLARLTEVAPELSKQLSPLLARVPASASI